MQLVWLIQGAPQPRHCTPPWALTVTGLRWLGRRPIANNAAGNAATATVVVGNLLACLATLPMALPVPPPEWRNASVLLYLGIFQIGLAYLLVTRAIRHVPAFEATTVLLLEPALNPVWVWLIQGERPSRGSLAGGGLILFATLLNAWWQSRGFRGDIGGHTGRSDVRRQP